MTDFEIALIVIAAMRPYDVRRFGPGGVDDPPVVLVKYVSEDGPYAVQTGVCWSASDGVISAYTTVEGAARAVANALVKSRNSTPTPPSAPDRFHDHLDICERCCTKPFDLCATGAQLLRNTADRRLSDTKEE
jgi:hypothetical protein